MSSAKAIKEKGRHPKAPDISVMRRAQTKEPRGAKEGGGKKKGGRPAFLERRGRAFQCCHCRSRVALSGWIGTAHRNHCPFCLWSRHVDAREPGDRKAKCGAGMAPIGLACKQETMNRYGVRRRGELMIVHECVRCGKISLNRIAGDDDAEMIIHVFEESKRLPSAKVGLLEGEGISMLRKQDREEIRLQLFGKK